MNMYTQGVWEVFEEDNVVGVIANGEADVAHCTEDSGGSFHSSRPLEETLANAHLISAAPDFLSVSEMLIEVFHKKGGGRSTDLHVLFKTLESVVAKAKGEK